MQEKIWYNTDRICEPLASVVILECCSGPTLFLTVTFVGEYGLRVKPQDLFFKQKCYVMYIQSVHDES